MADFEWLTCQELVELVTDYLEGALHVTDQARFEAHLKSCQGCRNYLEQMRRTIQLTGTLTDDKLSPQARNALLEVFRNWKKS